MMLGYKTWLAVSLPVHLRGAAQAQGSAQISQVLPNQTGYETAFVHRRAAGLTKDISL